MKQISIETLEALQTKANEFYQSPGEISGGVNVFHVQCVIRALTEQGFKIVREEPSAIPVSSIEANENDFKSTGQDDAGPGRFVFGGVANITTHKVLTDKGKIDYDAMQKSLDHANQSLSLDGRVRVLLLIANALHGNQQYGELPYTFHLTAVINEAIKNGQTDHVTLCACAFHDVLEDTEFTADDLRFFMRHEIVDIIEKVTDCEGKNRAERKAAGYEKIKNSPTAKAVKLYDRIANLRHSLDWRGKKNYKMLRMYTKEDEAFSKVYENESGLAMARAFLTYRELIDHAYAKLILRANSESKKQ